MGDSIGFHIILGNILLTAIAMVALLVGGWTSVAALTVCAAYFTVSTMAMILAATGGLRDVLIVWLGHTAHLIEIMILMAWQRKAAGSHMIEAANYQVLPEPVVSAPMLGGRTFVPAVLDVHEATRQEARAWVAGLFDSEHGGLDEHKVHVLSSSGNQGWLKVRAPVGAVRDLLLARGVLLQRQNGFALNLERIASFEDATVMLQ